MWKWSCYQCGVKHKGWTWFYQCRLNTKVGNGPVINVGLTTKVGNGPVISVGLTTKV